MKFAGSASFTYLSQVLTLLNPLTLTLEAFLTTSLLLFSESTLEATTVLLLEICCPSTESLAKPDFSSTPLPSPYSISSTAESSTLTRARLLE